VQPVSTAANATSPKQANEIKGRFITDINQQQQLTTNNEQQNYFNALAFTLMSPKSRV
jgi:hypothetical protein